MVQVLVLVVVDKEEVALEQELPFHSVKSPVFACTQLLASSSVLYKLQYQG